MNSWSRGRIKSGLCPEGHGRMDRQCPLCPIKEQSSFSKEWRRLNILCALEYRKGLVWFIASAWFGSFPDGPWQICHPVSHWVVGSLFWPEPLGLKFLMGQWASILSPGFEMLFCTYLNLCFMVLLASGFLSALFIKSPATTSWHSPLSTCLPFNPSLLD